MTATVGIVNYWGDVAWYARIRHQPGSFIVNHHTYAINGFKPWSLKNGHELDWVREQVRRQLTGKLVIACDAPADFRALGLNPEHFDVYDIQQFWRDANGRKYGLKNIYTHYFPEDQSFQQGVHDAVEDARATMRIFRDVFIQQFRPTNRYARIPRHLTFSRFY